MRLLVIGLLVSGPLLGCAVVNKTAVAGKEVTQVTKVGVAIFNSGGATVETCVEELSSHGVKTVISARGPADGGLFGITRSIGTTVTDVCDAVGSN
jgi:hypothetical protein